MSDATILLDKKTNKNKTTTKTKQKKKPTKKEIKNFKSGHFEIVGLERQNGQK